MLTNRSWLIIATLFMAAACGGSSTIGNSPCEGPNPPASCGVTCANDQQCDSGYHCNAQGACYAECTASGGECGNGYSCDGNGRCQPGNSEPPDADNCPRIEVTVSELIPTVQLLIDQSGSMNEPFGGVTRWQAMRSALVNQNDGIVLQLQGSVIFGATLYTSTGGNAGGTCPQLEEVPYALNNYEAIDALLRNNDPVVDTPTAESVNAVVDAFPPPNPQTPGPRILVLVTDGNPDNCVDPDAHDLSSQSLSESAVQNAYTKGIDTYVLSVGDEVSIPHLQRLANAGKGQPLATGTEPFYVALNPEELVAAFEQIVGGIRTCTFTLDGQVTDPSKGTVTLNGAPLEYGTDWTVRGGSTLELLGQACDTFLGQSNAQLSAEFECDGVVVL